MCKRCIWLIVSVIALALFTGLAQGQTVFVNFQTAASDTPEGYLPDSGQAFGDRGNGYSYGWSRDISADSRDRNGANSPDQRWDTLIHLEKGEDAIWEIELENGLYNIYIVAGDAGYTDQTNNFTVEGVIVEDPDGQAGNFDELNVTVTVADGRLTLTTADGSSNSKICFIDIVLAMAPEAARTPNPEDEATDVLRDLTVGWEPGDGVSAHDVYLGTSFDDVNMASRANPMDLLISQGQTATSLDVGRLEFGQTYYWRVDEVLAADGSIYHGDIWSFTVEPSMYAIENVVTSTNTTSDPGLGLENTVNGSGLNAEGQHSTISTDMWLGLPAGEEPLWIQYEFDQVYKLAEMLVWNYNVQFEPVLGFGLQNVTIEYSADGATWTALGDVEFAQATAREGYEANTTVDFGGDAVKMVKITINSNFGSLAQYGLGEVRFMHVPATAREPQPAAEASDIDVDSVLTWRPGREAASHDVYLGTDDDELALAGSVGDASFAPADLDFGTTYYWKVDEVNEAEAISVWPGPVWSFVAQEYATVDDFESYTDDEGSRIYEFWIDGWINETGSTVGYLEEPFAEQVIVNSGTQSMPLQYDNSNAPFYSESESDLGTVDLTANGADRLRLFFRGNPPELLEQADGSIVIGAAGADIWGTADECRFAFKTLTGDGEIIARVDSIDNAVDLWAKVGVMIRETADAGSRNTFMAMTAGNGGGATFQQRPANNVDSTSQHTLPGNPFALPYYVKLTRVGNDFTGSISPDGVTWQQAGDSVSVQMAGSVLVGLAVTSHSAGNAVSATFSEVATTGTVTGSWEVETMGVEMAANDPEPVYLALEDTSGRTQVVVHPDPAATAAAAWTEWSIPLSELTGINPASVRTMFIGVGDRDNPSAGGAGIIYVDDIEYGRPAPEPVPEPSYIYDGTALDDVWNHDNGSDEWDGTGPGEGRPGGVAALVEDDVTFLRVQDTGDPRDYDLGDPGSNRKIYLTRATDAALDGLSLEFCIRVATSAPLDDMHPDGGAGIEPWPAEGIAYHVRDGGKGMISVGEAELGVISFSLARGGQPGLEDVTGDVLVMNNLAGAAPSGDVDTEDTAATIVAKNWIAVDDATQWNTVAVDIVAGGAGTHTLTVSVNGGEAQTFDVTAGDGLEGEGSYLALGSSGTGGITAFDLDYVSYVLPDAQ